MNFEGKHIDYDQNNPNYWEDMKGPPKYRFVGSGNIKALIYSWLESPFFFSLVAKLNPPPQAY